MRRKVKFELIQTTCKRCGKELYTGNRSLLNNDEAKKKYERICGDCITPEEQQAISRIRPLIK